SRRKRGGVGCTMRSFAVTVLPSRKQDLHAVSCAKPRKRQVVSASGMVNCSFTTPLESASSWGKKNAVSLRFLRAETFARSGEAPAPGTFVGPDLSLA